MSATQRLLVVFTLYLFAGDAFARDAERIELSKEVVRLSQGEVAAQQMLDFLTPAIMGLSLQQNPDLSEEQKAKIYRLTKEELDAAMPELMDAAAQIYADHFSSEDLRNVIEFYQSPTGKKFQELVPKIMQESITRSETISLGVMQRVIDRLTLDGDI